MHRGWGLNYEVLPDPMWLAPSLSIPAPIGSARGTLPNTGAAERVVPGGTSRS